MERFLQTYCDSLFNLLSVFANKDNGIRFFNFFFASGIGFDNYPVWCTYFTYNLQMQKICMFLYFKIQWFMSIFNLNKQYFYFMCRSMFYFYDDLKINNGFWRKRTHINQFINHVPIYSFVFVSNIPQLLIPKKGCFESKEVEKHSNFVHLLIPFLSLLKIIALILYMYISEVIKKRIRYFIELFTKIMLYMFLLI